MQKGNTETLKTILVITLGFLVIYIIWDIRWALYIALGVSLAGSISNFLAKQIHFIWMKLSWLLGLIVPKILLTVIYYFVLFPIALISKVFRNKTNIIKSRKVKSLFVDYEKKIMAESFEKPW